MLFLKLPQGGLLASFVSSLLESAEVSVVVEPWPIPITYARFDDDRTISEEIRCALWLTHEDNAYLPSDPHLAGLTSIYTSNYLTSKTSLKTSICGDTILSFYYNNIYGFLHLFESR